MSCCNSCASGGPCSGPKLGGTSVKFPGRLFAIPTRSANRPLLGAVTCSGGTCTVGASSIRPAAASSSTGSSFWSAFLDPTEIKGETFTKAFEAGLKAPRAQAMDLSRMLDVRVPSFDAPRFSLPDSRPLSEIASSVPQYGIESPGSVFGGSRGGGVSRSGILLGLGAVAAVVLVLKSRKAKPALAKP